MNDFEQHTISVDSGMSTLARFLRIAATVLGIVAIVIGLVYATRIFEAAYSNLRAPEGIEGLLDRWEAAVDEDDLTFNIDGERHSFARVVGIVVLGMGGVVLAWLAMGIMVTGAKIISLTAGDREAVKKILTHAFGPAGKAPGHSTSDQT